MRGGKGKATTAGKDAGARLHADGSSTPHGIGGVRGETTAAMDTTIYWEGQLKMRIDGGNDPLRKDRHPEDAPPTATRRVPGPDPDSRELPSPG